MNGLFNTAVAAAFAITAGSYVAVAFAGDYGSCGNDSKTTVVDNTHVAGDRSARVMHASFNAEKDIVDTAVAAGSFKTLAALLTQAGLVETLKGEGPFTVFAPTDEAFAKVPKETLEALGKDKEALIKVLTSHVVAGSVDARTAAGLDSAKTVQGSEIKISIQGGQLTINNAKVVANDVTASNGVIHVIDTVLLPPAEGAAKSAGYGKKSS